MRERVPRNGGVIGVSDHGGWAAVAAAAEARGWPVYWYNAKKVFDAAGKALRVKNLDALFLKVRKSVGAPWSQDHKLAMAAAIVAANARERKIKRAS